MRLESGRWRCTWCGEFVDDIPSDVTPTTEIHASAGQPNYRVVFVERREVHRCVARDQPAQL
jgi:hypothetical protein